MASFDEASQHLRGHDLLLTARERRHLDHAVVVVAERSEERDVGVVGGELGRSSADDGALVAERLGQRRSVEHPEALQRSERGGAHGGGGVDEAGVGRGPVSRVAGQRSRPPAAADRVGHERPASSASAATMAMASTIARSAPKTTLITPRPVNANSRFQIGVRRYRTVGSSTTGTVARGSPRRRARAARWAGLEGLTRSMKSSATIAPAASAKAHVVTKVDVVEEIATNEDTVANSVLPPPSEAWAPPEPPIGAAALAPPGAPAPPRIVPPRPRARRWGIPFAVLGALLLVFVAVATWLPTDRYAIAPGEAQAVAPRVDLSAKRYDSKGKLLFVTVSIPKLSLLGRLVAAVDPDVEVKTAREVFGDQTREENRAANLKLMGYSKDTAAYVALKRLGYDVGLTGGGPVIESLCLEYKDPDDPKSACVRAAPADAVLDPGDAIVAVDGHPVVLPGDVAPLLEGKSAGDEVTVTIYPAGSDQKKDVVVPLTTSADGTRTIIGFVPVDGGVHADLGYRLPVTTSITSDQIGGPSAGLAFTLTLLDELTPGDITGGKKIAATGSINLDGTVGNIGGLHQKTVAVKNAGASYFLVPADLVEEAEKEAKGSSLKIIGVKTVDEALAVLAALGGDVSGIPPAPAASAA